MGIRAVIDMNVIISRLLSSYEDSPVKIILKLVSFDIIEPIYSKPIFEEYKKVLKREKFSFNNELIGSTIDLFLAKGHFIVPVASNIVLLDEGDLPFYEALIADRTSCLKTSNLKHFPNSPLIISPRDFVERLR